MAAIHRFGIRSPALPSPISRFRRFSRLISCGDLAPSLISAPTPGGAAGSCISGRKSFKFAAVRQRLPVCDEETLVRAADLRQHRIDPGAGFIAVGALNDGDENCDDGLTLLVAQLLDHSLVLPQVIIAPAMDAPARMEA